MREESDTRDIAVARIAARQHGVITVSQLHEAGLDKSAISRRLKRARLHRIHHGVYAVGHRGLSLHGRLMAAVLACGDGAVLSHTSAAVLWKLLRQSTVRFISRSPLPPAARGAAESPSTVVPRSPQTQRSRLLTTHCDRIPVTTVPRAIEDLEDYVPSGLYRRAKRQAELINAAGPECMCRGSRTSS